jgi:hypothetical protein
MDLLWFRPNVGNARSRLYTSGKRNRGSDVPFNNGHLSRPGNLPDPVPIGEFHMVQCGTGVNRVRSLANRSERSVRLFCTTLELAGAEWPV